jgi:4-amino-4-deoxy-L-arabinose transferase-like glycosyltransferase
MLETGDWLVPRTQHVYLPSRPPLQNWWIAFDGFLFGSFGIWAVRLPSILSTLIIAVIIYGYLRQQFSSLGSTAGAASFLTMQLVMEFGRSAETEAVFTVFVAASLLLWHWGWIKKWPAWQIWSVDGIIPFDDRSLACSFHARTSCRHSDVRGSFRSLARSVYLAARHRR